MNIHAISSSSKSGISVKLGFEFEAAKLYILAFVVKQKIPVRNSHYSRISKQGIPCIKFSASSSQITKSYPRKKSNKEKG